MAGVARRRPPLFFAPSVPQCTPGTRGARSGCPAPYHARIRRPRGAVSTSPLDELDGVAVRISDPSGAQPAIEKVMSRREQRRARGDQGVHRGIGVVGPKHDFDPAPFAFRTKAMVLLGCLYCRNSEAESIQFQLDMGRLARRRSAKRFNKP
jgi:hypothetical protein